MPPNSCLLRPRCITVQIGTPLTFEGVSNDRAGWEQIAGKLEEAVRGLAGLRSEEREQNPSPALPLDVRPAYNVEV